MFLSLEYYHLHLFHHSARLIPMSIYWGLFLFVFSMSYSAKLVLEWWNEVEWDCRKGLKTCSYHCDDSNIHLFHHPARLILMSIYRGLFLFVFPMSYSAKLVLEWWNEVEWDCCKGLKTCSYHCDDSNIYLFHHSAGLIPMSIYRGLFLFLFPMSSSAKLMLEWWNEVEWFL